MIIDLPKEFSSDSGYIVSDKLYLNNLLGFERLIYTLTYDIYGNYCYYCGKKLRNNSKTLDHLYPRAIGGISITNNLRPSCSKCNLLKSNKTERQFIETKLLKKRDINLYEQSLKIWQEKIFKTTGFFLPNNWITTIDLNIVKGVINPNRPLGQKYFKHLSFYEKYNNLPKPIVIDANFNLLDGWNVLAVAQKYGRIKIPSIWCENVFY